MKQLDPSKLELSDQTLRLYRRINNDNSGRETAGQDKRRHEKSKRAVKLVQVPETHFQIVHTLDFQSGFAPDLNSVTYRRKHIVCIILEGR